MHEEIDNGALMNYSLRFDKYFRTRLRVHYSWILVVILITWVITTQFSTDISFWQRVASGVVASALFFSAIVVREFVLVLLATYKGISIESVTIFAFGGLVRADQETTSPTQEFILALAGMLANLTITCIFYVAYIISVQTNPTMISVVIKWLAFLYFSLTLFHIIPGYPLEGGRILRAILWKVFDDGRHATQVTNWISWTLGIIITICGILVLAFTVERFTGGFLILIGLILQNAATHSRRQLHNVILPIEMVNEEAVSN
ncbi:hypothetical protein ACFLVJ_01050 [Chloroflexota bacterium]